MSLTAVDNALTKILLVDSQYTIPRNQRKYIWEREQIEYLFNDILYNMQCVANGKTYNHFIGSFIFQKEGKKLKIIDGQQRLTTLTLLLAVIIKFLKFYNKNTLATNTIPYVASKDDEIEDKYNMRIDNRYFSVYSMLIFDFCINDNEFFNAYDFLKKINKQLSSSDKKYVNNCNILIELVQKSLEQLTTAEEKSDWLKRFRETVLALGCIEITSTEEQEGYIVFETLNARGVPLEQAELIKNYIFMYTKGSSGSDLPEEKWNNLIGTLETCKEGTVKLFFSHYITHKYGKVTSAKEYQQIRNNVPPAKVNNLLDDLIKKSRIYKDICEPDTSNYSSIVKYVLKYLNEINNKQFRPLLLSVLTAFENGQMSESYLNKFFINIKNFISIFFTICQRKANDLEELIYENSLALSQTFSKQKLDAFMVALYEKKPNYELFCQQFYKIGFSKHKDKYPELSDNSKKRCQHIIRECELYKAGIEDGVLPTFTIEHIKADSQGGKACYVGNMLPLLQRENKNLKDKSFDEKIVVCNSSCFKSTNQFASRYKSWYDEDIVSRSKYLAKALFEDVWQPKS